MLVVDRYGVGGFVSILIILYHHPNFQLVQPLLLQANTDEPPAAPRRRNTNQRNGPSPRILRARTDEECLMIQAICCVDTALAARMRSPSFSRSRSSTTIMNSPALNAAIVLSILSSSIRLGTAAVALNFGALIPISSLLIS